MRSAGQKPVKEKPSHPRLRGGQPGHRGHRRMLVEDVDEVDPGLGTVKVTDIVAIHDVGQVINRVAVEGQIEGGVAMGIGYALYESVSLKTDGKWVDSFTEYLIPTAEDVPPAIETVILKVPEASGPMA